MDQQGNPLALFLLGHPFFTGLSSATSIICRFIAGVLEPSPGDSSRGSGCRGPLQQLQLGKWREPALWPTVLRQSRATVTGWDCAGEAAESVRTGPVGSSRGTASEGREPSSPHVASATGIRDCSSPYLASPIRAGIKTSHGSDPGMTQTSQEVSRLMI